MVGRFFRVDLRFQIRLFNPFKQTIINLEIIIKAIKGFQICKTDAHGKAELPSRFVKITNKKNMLFKDLIKVRYNKSRVTLSCPFF